MRWSCCGDLDRHLGRRFLDVVVADALYLQQGFVNAVEGFEPGMGHQREGESTRIAGGNAATNRAVSAEAAPSPDPEERSNSGTRRKFTGRSRTAPFVCVKTLRVQKVRRVQVLREARGKKKKTRQTVPQESTNYYATNLELGSIPPGFVHELGRSRWRVDTEVFQTLTTPAYLKQPSVHQTEALVLLTMIRVLAYTLSLVFDHRQVVSHARRTPPTFSEMARLLAYLFLSPHLDSS